MIDSMFDYENAFSELFILHRSHLELFCVIDFW